MSRQFEPTEDPRNPEGNNVIDTGKRYDVYCTEGPHIAVYRNAFFRSIKGLYRAGQFDSSGEFIELELPDGKVVYLARYNLVKFCAPGSNPTYEIIGPR